MIRYKVKEKGESNREEVKELCAELRTNSDGSLTLQVGEWQIVSLTTDGLLVRHGYIGGKEFKKDREGRVLMKGEDIITK